MKAQVRFAGRTAQPFEEAAEVLGITTEYIVGCMEKDGKMTVLYSPNPEDARKVYSVILARDGGVLRLSEKPQLVPGFWENMEAKMKEAQADD